MGAIKVAVMNTSKEITEILQEALEDEGFHTCTIYTYELKEDLEKFDEFVKANKPSVIVYDIAIPYEENYALFKIVAEQKCARRVGFVLTTTNRKILNELVGETGAYEIVGKPYDLLEIVSAAKLAYLTKHPKKARTTTTP